MALRVQSKWRLIDLAVQCARKFLRHFDWEFISSIPERTYRTVMSDPQPTSSPDQSQMMLLMQQMIELQRENNELRRNMSGASNFSSNAKKPDRPIIEQDSTDNDWALFTDSWQRYKDMCRLRDISEIRNELRSSCSSDVNKLLFDLIGSDRLNSASEAELLTFIKSVAVKGMHK